MRSKEVDYAIEIAKKIMEFNEYTSSICDLENIEGKEIDNALDTVLAYIEELEKQIERFNNELDLDYVDKNFVSKEVIKELKEKIHNLLDNNGITRAYQLAIDKMFDEILGE